MLTALCPCPLPSSSETAPRVISRAPSQWCHPVASLPEGPTRPSPDSREWERCPHTPRPERRPDPAEPGRVSLVQSEPNSLPRQEVCGTSIRKRKGCPRGVEFHMADDRGGAWKRLSANPLLRVGVFRSGRNVYHGTGRIGHSWLRPIDRDAAHRLPGGGSVASRPDHTSGETSPRAKRQDEFC